MPNESEACLWFALLLVATLLFWVSLDLNFVADEVWENVNQKEDVARPRWPVP